MYHEIIYKEYCINILEHIKNGDLQAIRKDISLLNYQRTNDISVDNNSIYDISQSDKQDPYYQEFLRTLFNSSLDMIRYFIEEYDLDINTQDQNGKTVLVYAILKEDIELIKYLLSKNIDPSIRDENDYTALMWVSLLGNVEIAKLLIDYGVTLNNRDVYGNTELILAANYNELIQFLITSGSDINLQNNHGFSLLMCVSGCLEQVKFLISKGADINARNIDGKDVFILASEQGALDVVKYLVSLNLDIHTTDNQGSNLLISAASHGRFNVVKYLVDESKIDPEICDLSGKNALAWALTNHHYEVALYLEKQK